LKYNLDGFGFKLLVLCVSLILWAASSPAYASVLAFTSPTEANGSSVARNYVYANVSITATNLTDYLFNWNGTNQSVYDRNLSLSLGLDSNAAIGESSSRVTDVSRYAVNCSQMNASASGGVYRGALRFSGPDSYVICGNSSALGISRNMSIEAWIKSDGVTFWAYRQVSVVSSLNLSDYQLRLVVPYSSYMRSDYGDVRIFDSDNAVLKYWLESYNSSAAVFWVKVPNIPAGQKTLNIYYGDQSLSSLSNGSLVFDFFEDFENYSAGQNLNGVKNWSANAGNITASTKFSSSGSKSGNWQLGIPAGGQGAFCEFGQKTSDFILEYSYLRDLYGCIFGTIDQTNWGSSTLYNLNRSLYYRNSSGGDTLITNSLNNGTWYRFTEIHHPASKKYDLKINEGAIYSSSNRTYNRQENPRYFKILSATGDEVVMSVYFDDLRIRKYAASEPVATVGSENLPGISTAGFQIGMNSVYAYSIVKNQTAAQVINASVSPGWNHIAETYNGSLQSLYVNGKLVSSKRFTGNLYTPSTALYIKNMFNTTIDEVKVYNRSLTGSEVQRNYRTFFGKYDQTTWGFYITVDNLSAGRYSYYGWANDSAGKNYTDSGKLRYVDVDLRPVLYFVSPTKANGTLTNKDYADVNISIHAPSQEVNSFVYGWNGTNYIMQDDSLVLAYDYDKIAGLGEDDGRVADYSTGGDYGTVSGAAWSSNGRYGGAMDFDGVNDVIMSPSTARIRPESFTYAVWVKYSQYQVSKPIMGCYYGPLGGALLATDDSDGAKILVKVNNASQKARSISALNDSSWHYVVASWNGFDLKLFVDGNLESTVSVLNNPVYPQTGIYLGGSMDGQYFKGSMDEPRVYTRALTAEEIAIGYASNLQRYNLTEWRFTANMSSLSQGTYYYSGWANDAFGRWNQTDGGKQRYLLVDKTKPATTLSGVGDNGEAYAQGSVYNGSYVNITLTCSDNNACNKTYYCLDNETFNATCDPANVYSAPVKISRTGTSYVRYRSSDSAGNLEDLKSGTVRISESTKPVTTASAVSANGSAYAFGTWANTTYVNVTLTCFDASGCDSTSYCLDTSNYTACSPAVAYSAPVMITATGVSYIRFRSNDTSGNYEDIKYGTVKIGSEPGNETNQTCVLSGNLPPCGEVSIPEIVQA
jgi:hypothetical protein